MNFNRGLKTDMFNIIVDKKQKIKNAIVCPGLFAPANKNKNKRFVLKLSHKPDQ